MLQYRKFTFTALVLYLKNQFEKLKHYLFKSDDLIINWSDFDKGVLLLIFGVCTQLGATIWYLLVYFSENRMWLNLDFFPQRLLSVSLTTLVFIVLTIASYKYQDRPRFRMFISYFTPLFFGAVMIYSGYTVGIYSAATIAGTVNIVLVGLVFYRRVIVYSIVTPVSLFILYVCYQSYYGEMRYAPVFSDALNQSDLYQNPFWITSMTVLYLPILVVTAVFFEVLLSQWRRREKKIQIMSQTDALTGVFNRRYVTEQLADLERNGDYAVVLLDLDHFKQINDNYGHEAGDLVLTAVASLLIQCVRTEDIVGRFGGEEFILILRATNDLSQAVEVVERCRQALENETIMLDSRQKIKVSASFGVTIAQHRQSKEAVLRLADQALYQAKAQGRNRICTEAFQAS